MDMGFMLVPPASATLMTQSPSEVVYGRLPRPQTSARLIRRIGYLFSGCRTIR